MDPADSLRARQVGNGASDAKDAVEAARAQPHRRRRIGEQLAARLVGRGDCIEQFAVGLRIGPDSIALEPP